MEISFTYTKNEWLEGRKQYLFLSKTITRLQVFVTLFLSVYTVFSFLYLGRSTINIALSVIVAVMILMLLFLYFIQPIVIFRTTEKYHHLYKMRFDSENISFDTQGISSILSWNLYSGYWETKANFYLLQGKLNYTLLPKRAFSYDKIKGFRAMLESHFVASPLR